MKLVFNVVLTLIIVSGLLLMGCSEPAPEPTTSPSPSASPTPAEPDKVYELTYAMFQPEKAALSVMNTEFAREIEKRTNNRVKITIHPGGSLLGAPAMYSGVIDGIADMGNAVSSYDPGAFPFTSIAELPTNAESGWAVSNALYDFMQEYQPEEWKDVHILTTCSTAADFLAIYMGKKEVKTMEDWKGLSVRTNHADIVAAMGGTVKDVPMSDVYDSLSKGVLDAVMGSPEPLKSWKFGEVCDYVTVNAAPVQPSILWYNAMNKDTWEKLPADIQQIISDVSREYSAKLGLTWDDQAVAGIEHSVSLGKSVYMLPKEEEDRWTAAILPIVDERLATVAKEGNLSAEEVEEIWTYFKGRVDYWNGQQAANDVTPVIERIDEVMK